MDFEKMSGFSECGEGLTFDRHDPTSVIADSRLRSASRSRFNFDHAATPLSAGQ